ncbi:hypothetical protein SAMN05421878_11058 [Actinobaculum suis]|uniref:TadE-like protein n=1 Tax=Actinobaculum suis TaxID=1657 RepID=A0A1G7DC98_9ACTO|nr:hypothetical protein [Actinobaculum suis]MDY5153346.1 hypothetical protein [Actinobaculum suis]SDE48566.1 hypothetical protein SAMN05421878_11058 [Actinobaculum suis]
MNQNGNTAERGNVIVEAVGAMTIFGVSLIVLALAAASIFSASSAATTAAREAARAFVQARDTASAERRAASVAAQALADQGVESNGGISVQCSDNPCLTPGATVTISVHARAPIPYFGTAVQITRSNSMLVDRYRQMPAS